jgi:hypothetical protein
MNFSGCAPLLACSLLSRRFAHLRSSLFAVLVFAFASTLAATEVNLVWEDNSADETGFKIERSISGGSWSQIATVGANITSYKDTGLVAGTKYGYRVRAYNTVGDSAYSNVVEHTIPTANTAPTLGSIADQSIWINGVTSSLAFTVNDAETSASALTVSGSSSDTALVPNSNLLFGGSGSNRTLTVTPAANKTGTTTITYSVSDGILSTSKTFKVTVNAAANTAPTISSIADKSISINSNTGSLAFTVGDAETSASALTVSGSSSNPTLISSSGISFGGSGSNRNVTITPAANQSGSATITVNVNDGSLTTSTTFTVTVTAPSNSNTAPTISSIADKSIPVNSNTGSLAFTVGDAETSASALTVSGASSNTTLVPVSGISLGGSGTNRNVTVTPVANQTGTATITVTVSDGSLTSSSQFKVTVTSASNTNTAPTISPIDDQTIVQNSNTGPLSFSISDAQTAANNLTLTRTTSNATVIPLSGVTFSGTGTNRSVTVVPSNGRTGSSTITITVSDGSLTTSTSFTVNVTSRNGGGTTDPGTGGGGGGTPISDTSPSITTQPVSRAVTTGETATFTVVASASPAPTYQWRKDGVAISGATSASYSISNVQSSHAGAYDVVVTNSLGKVTSQPAMLSINLPTSAGTYSGKFAQGGSWILQIKKNGTGTYTAELTHLSIALVLQLKVNKDGTFTVVSTEVSQLGGGAIAASLGGSSDLRSFNTTPKTVELAGKVEDGKVEGTISSLGLSFSGELDSDGGPAASFAGFYTASISDGGEGSVYASVRPNGETIYVISTGGLVDWATGWTDAKGVFTGISAYGATINGKISVSTGILTGTYQSFVLNKTLKFDAPKSTGSGSRLINASIRTGAGTGSNTLIAGFYVRGSTPKTMLIRAVGPTLAGFGVTDALNDPALALFAGQTQTESNDDWTQSDVQLIKQVSNRTGAFPLTDGSRDAVLLSSLNQGSYTAQVTAKNGQPGTALIELYDADLGGDSRLVNISARSFVGSGNNVLIVGFVISGTQSREVLIRGIGPSLAKYGVSGVLADPRLQLYREKQLIDENNDWGGDVELTQAFARVGAFGLDNPGSGDAVMKVTLPPGAYSAILSGTNNTTGVALMELYEMP